MRLIGEVNEATVLIGGIQTKALVDSGAQMSAMTDSFTQQLGLPVQKLGKILNLEVMGEGSVPFSGYVERELNLPCISGFHEDCLFSVIPNSPYCQHVPIQLGTIHIDWALELATEEDLENLDWKWKRGQIAGLLAAKAVEM